MDTAPVRHNDALIAPFSPQNFIEQNIMMAAVCSAQLIVGTHDSFCLAPFYRCLKARQINLPERPLADLHVYVQTPCLLIVHRKVLHARRHVILLNSLYQRNNKLRDKIGVLAHVLKTPPAQR